MDSTDLNFFLAVATKNGIGRAANELNTVQSNVTQRIRSLEVQLGVQLFHRSKKGVTLTPMGNRLLPYATQISDLLVAAKRAVKEDGEPAGELRVGSLETTAALRLPPILTAYSEAFPGVDVQVETGSTDLLIERVLERKLEGAFVTGPVTHPDLEAVPVTEEELVLASPAAVTSRRALGSFLGDPRHRKAIVFRAGCSYRRRMEEYFSDLGLVDVRWMEMGTLDGIIGCVSASVGVALLPKAVVLPAALARQISIHHLPSGKGKAVTVFVRRRDGFYGSALKNFVECAVQTSRPVSPEPARSRRPTAQEAVA